MKKIVKSLIALSALFPGLSFIIGLGTLFTTIFETPNRITTGIAAFTILIILSMVSNVIIWVDYIKNIFKGK